MSTATSTRSPSPASSTSSTPEEEEYTYQADQHPSLTASQERAAMAAHSSSRAQSPVAPAPSPLTPKPNSSDGRPAPDPTLQLTEIIELEDTPPSGPRTDRKDVAQLLEGDKVLLSPSAEITEPEHTTNMLPTPDEVSGLTPRKDLSSIPQSEHGQDTSDRNRATELEEASSRARLATRVSAEQSLDEQSPKRASKADIKAPATFNLKSESQDGEQAVPDGLPKQAVQETCARGGIGEQGVAEPKDESDATPSRRQAEWVSAAVSSCKTNKKVTPMSNSLRTKLVLTLHTRIRSSTATYLSSWTLRASTNAASSTPMTFSKLQKTLESLVPLARRPPEAVSPRTDSAVFLSCQVLRQTLNFSQDRLTSC